MVKDVECGESRDMTEYPSIAECWKWLKGLLYDFINMKKHNEDLKMALTGQFGESSSLETLRMHQS